MGSRGQKRAEEAEELPADKRACSSLEFRASSSNSSWLNSENSGKDDNIRNADMDTSSSASASGSRSEEDEPERDSGYGSCESDDMDPRHSSLRAFQRRRSSGDHSRLRSALGSLREGADPSTQVAALTELCEVLSFCTEDSLSSTMAELLSPVIVKLARHDNSPEIMLLAIRALTYMCDVFPRASGSLVRHEAVPALCDRLMAIEYLDVAEQCLQALEKISREEPHACLQAGAIMAVLSFIDFFSTSVQRVAVSTVVNICKKLPADCSSHFMIAVPILCNLLQYEDRQLVENVAICLIKIAERVGQSSELLDELCKHGLVSQAARLIHLNSCTTLSPPIYNGLIGLLCKLSSGSILALRTLYDLNICSILKDILAASDLSRGMSSINIADVQSNQVHEVLKLLNELLPNLRDQDVGSQLQVSDKVSFFAEHPDLLPLFGLDVLPMLIQVVNAGANMYVCYGCLSIIYKLIYFSNSDTILELIRNANIPSFLAGVLIRQDHHVLTLALRIAETILQKYQDAFLNSFIKEGVFFAIDVLMTPQKCSLSMFPKFNAIPLPADSSQKFVSKVSMRCLCYAFDTGQSPPPSETGICMLPKDSVQSLATHIRSSYFAQELNDSEKGLTDIFQDLRALSAQLSDVKPSSADKNGPFSLDSKQTSCILQEIIRKLNGKEHVSSFEFIGSGTAKSLINYISNGRYLVGNESLCHRGEDDCIVEKRFEGFGKLILSSMDGAEALPLVNIVRKLQSALSSLENFPVVLSHQLRQRNSFATVPHGHYVSHPCLRVRFQKIEGEIGLGEYSHDVVTIDPFSSLDEIEQFLLPKVRISGTENVEVPAQPVQPTETTEFKTPADVNFGQATITNLLESHNMSTDLPQMQENEADTSQSSLEGVENSRLSQPAATSVNESPAAATQLVVQLPSEQNTSMCSQNPVPLCNIDSAQRMLFYLDDKQLDRNVTLYQAILQQKLKSDPETDTSLKLWSQTYVLSYGTTAKCNDVEPIEQFGVPESSPLSDKVRMQNPSFFSGMFDCKLSSILDPSSSTYDIVWLLKSLERLNRFSFHLMSRERVHAFAEGLIDNLDCLKVAVTSVTQNEFMNCKLSEKLEQQMRDSLAVSIGGMPLWCSVLMQSCPFFFTFETKSKYFRLSAFGPPQGQRHPSTHMDHGGLQDRQPSPGGSPRKKFLVHRERILESAVEMMDLYASAKLPVEVVYDEEVGTGLGPTLEFYTLVSHEFQKSGIGMWREDHGPSATDKSITYPFGLFPRPWPSALDTSSIQFSDVIKKFVLLGQFVAKALQDGRFLDLQFSKAFYKLILQQELDLHDIQSFDPELGRTLVEFKALVYRKKHLESAFADSSFCPLDACFRDSRIEDLCLDFSLPGYPEYPLGCHQDDKMVNLANLDEYLALTVDATLCSGIYRQFEAFKCGFNKVFPIDHLSIFTEEELERLICGEHDFSDFDELVDHIKFDHGYTASSHPIVHLLQILREFNYEQRRAFLQFVTGAPRLPPGGLASLNPKLTIVRKHCCSCVDEDLPSVMTCANYLKLPPYSSKEKMKEKLIYAITEGQGSFHLS